MEKNNLWSTSQFGFRKHHSTEHAILKFTTDIQDLREKHKLFVAVFLDVSKAFNCLDKNILHEKLGWYGIQGAEKQLISDYFENRRQISVIGDAMSSSKNVRLGTPQGGVFSATAFILYINDLCYSHSMNSVIYADDTTVYKGFDNWTELEEYTNIEL